MEKSRMGEQVVQCIACQKVKNSEGAWICRNVKKPGIEVSHTYCSSCIQTFKEKLFAARDFEKWDFAKQIDYLSRELDKQYKKYDERSFRTYLEEFFCLNSKTAVKVAKALRHKFVENVCACCNKEMKDEELRKNLGSLQMHSHCYREISWKLRIIQESRWDISDKLDAYFDLLRIEKDLRPTLKIRLKDLRIKAGTAA